MDLWLIRYATQAQGQELVYYANHVAAPDAWHVESLETRPHADGEHARHPNDVVLRVRRVG